MQESDKRVIVMIMNVIALIGNLFSLVGITAMYFLSPYVKEFAETLETSEISILPQIIILGICAILSIINLVISKDMQKNKNKIAFIMAITMIIGSIYNIIAGFVCIIIIYKKKKRRNSARNKNIRRYKKFK